MINLVWWSMVETNQGARQERKVFTHEKGKYVILNSAEQTPAFYVVGRKYKVGTGIAVIETNPRQVIKNFKSTYKEFLSTLLKKYTPEELVAFKWVPARVMRAEKLIQQECSPEQCVKSCVQPGCFCIDGTCQKGA